MMHRWGPHLVSSALEVYIVLVHAPGGKTRCGAWEYQLALEPPVWGGNEAHRSAYALAARGFYIWSWDDYGVTFSRPGTVPPRGVFYRSWYAIECDGGLSPRSHADPSVGHRGEPVSSGGPNDARLVALGPNGGARLCFSGFPREEREPSGQAPRSLEERSAPASWRNESPPIPPTKGNPQ